MSIELPPLPYPSTALAPHISERTIDFHYGKHHATYVANVNRITEGTDLATTSLDDMIRTVEPGALFNSAAQVSNHNIYWASMSPDGGGDPSGDLAVALDAALGSVNQFRTELQQRALGHFGSGWVWLVDSVGGLQIVETHDADSPLRAGMRPLLTIDVWEHAYYLDYQNARAAYVETWLTHLVNWDHAAKELAAG